jgi:arylsulfatase A-like enzyme
MRKGPEMPEVLMRIPLFFTGPGVLRSSAPHTAHVSIVDIMPTICEMLGIPLPPGVQGRSLWPLLTGRPYPPEEFASIYGEQGFGGLRYAEQDNPDVENCVFTLKSGGRTFDELNMYSQSGWLRMICKADWKLLMNEQGQGQLYNLARDPRELENLYDVAQHKDVQCALAAELLAWMMKAQDSLPDPDNQARPRGTYTRYALKTDPRNYWTLHR